LHNQGVGITINSTPSGLLFPSKPAKSAFSDQLGVPDKFMAIAWPKAGIPKVLSLTFGSVLKPIIPNQPALIGQSKGLEDQSLHCLMVVEPRTVNYRSRPPLLPWLSANERFAEWSVANLTLTSRNTSSVTTFSRLV
jgi:hypothetical protein